VALGSRVKTIEKFRFRTGKMHEDAELGGQRNWRYKEAQSFVSSYAYEERM